MACYCAARDAFTGMPLLFVYRAVPMRRLGAPKPSPAGLAAHEGADMLGPFRPERRIRAGRQPHGVAGEILLAVEIPGAGPHLDRGDLVLPPRLAQPRLFLAGRHHGAGEARLRIDRDLAAALRDRRRRDERGGPRRRAGPAARAQMHATP